MSDTAFTPRTPLHEMSVEQLRFIAEDELEPPWRREIAEMLLGERKPDPESISDLALRVAPYSLH